MVGSLFSPFNEEMTLYDFFVEKEHLFLSNIDDEDDLNNSDVIKDRDLL